MKYSYHMNTIPTNKRKELNDKVLYLIDSDEIEKISLTPEDLFNAYTGDGGLHELKRNDYANYSDFSQAKKEVEKRTTRGQKNIFIKTRNRSFTINHDNILYIENRGKKVEIHTSNEIIETYASMNDLEKQLGGNFYRCHRGYLVNMAHIAEYENDSISLSNGENIFMAKERYNEFVKEYMRYLRNGGTACV